MWFGVLGWVVEIAWKKMDKTRRMVEGAVER